MPDEHHEQKHLFSVLQVLTEHTPEMGLIFAVPNGGHRHKSVAKKMRAEGVKPGVPDICWPVARGIYHGLFVEMKRLPHRARNGKIVKSNPSSKQRRWLAALKKQGYYTAKVEGADEALSVINRYWGMGRFCLGETRT